MLIVSILILMEVVAEVTNKFSTIWKKKVSILILMEVVAEVSGIKKPLTLRTYVSILILMEVVAEAYVDLMRLDKNWSFNPYSDGGGC